MRSERHADAGAVGRVALLGRVRRWGRIAARHGQRVRVSGGLEQVGGEHGVGDGPGEREPLALVLHPPILEPDLDGGLLEAQLGGQLAAARSGNVSLLEEFLFATGQLFAAKGRPVAAHGGALLIVGVVVVAVGRAGGGSGSGSRAGFYRLNNVHLIKSSK